MISVSEPVSRRSAFTWTSTWASCLKVSLRAAGGYADAWVTAGEFRFHFVSIQAGGVVAWQLGRMPPGQALAWDGLSLRLGFSWLDNRISTKVKLATISQVFSVDADGDGPILPLDVVLKVNPRFDVGLQSQAWAVPLQLSTGLRLAEFLCIGVGIGAMLDGGSAALAVDGTQEIELQGFLNDLISEPGTIKVQGAVKGGKELEFNGFLTGAIQLRTKAFVLSVPLCWRFDNGLSLGLVMGVEL